MNSASASVHKQVSFIDLQKLTISQILLYLGGLIIFIAAITYITLNWNGWNSAIRIMAMFVPMAGLFAVGTALWIFKKESQSLFFVFTSAIVFPLFLIITFKELSLFGDPMGTQFQFFVSVLSLLVYVALRFIFPSAVWVFMYCLVGAQAWYLLLRFSNIADPTTGGLIWWLMLPLVAVYSAIGVYLERKDKSDFAKYAFLVAVILLILNLFALSVTGELLKPFLGKTNSKDIQLWSSLVSGGILLIASWVCEKSKDYKLTEPSKYAGLFNFFGTFGVLSSLFSLGLGDKKPVYETALLFASLAFVFASTLKVSRSFLYIGTLYVITYIFSIGGEYFQNQIGWPLTLLLAGLLSMGVGLALEVIRRKYFNVKTTKA